MNKVLFGQGTVWTDSIALLRIWCGDYYPLRPDSSPSGPHRQTLQAPSSLPRSLFPTWPLIYARQRNSSAGSCWSLDS
jgi:hypothetical protein